MIDHAHKFTIADEHAVRAVFMLGEHQESHYTRRRTVCTVLPVWAKEKRKWQMEKQARIAFSE